MSEFYEVLEEYMGGADALTDRIVCVRRCFFYDFIGYPTYLWQGKGRLHTTDGNTWLGTIDANDRDIHTVPALQDGRDGSSASYNLGLVIPNLPDESASDLYDALKADQSLAYNRKVVIYLAIFKEDEALRPQTPIIYFKELLMGAPKFSERISQDGTGISKRYSVSVTARDNNFGRSRTPNRTYADTMQKQRALELGVPLDRGAEFLAGLANRTYQIP
jgi:hypothetical protein